MQPRGKTCFLQHTNILMKQKSEKVPQKKPTRKIDVLKNQLKKCNLEVRHAFCNTQKNTTDPKLRKGTPKIEPQMKHTNETHKHKYCPKIQPCTM